MDSQQFRTPMVVCAGSPRRFSLVSTVAEATDFLIDHRAKNDCAQWTDAMNQCAGAEIGTNSVASAGSAFVLALRAAGIQIDTTVLLY
ncbi:DUF982 domain-containing protein [Pseudaminobacter arsenicus]|uniref:DUF982 domain-containing protein n=1 Tax=Borborobacter arsenicus TaxID=1851146 RepID=A0A432UYZ5_9HYPH|nr:DUF982 domain-containing protein [Pseudaminobacter arsenicus]